MKIHSCMSNASSWDSRDGDSREVRRYVFEAGIKSISTSTHVEPESTNAPKLAVFLWALSESHLCKLNSKLSAERS